MSLAESYIFTYTISLTGTPDTEAIWGVWNNADGFFDHVYKVWRIGLLAAENTGLPGEMVLLTFKRFTEEVSWTTDMAGFCYGMSSGLTPDADLTLGYGGVPTTTGSQDTFRRVMWSTSGPTVSGATLREWECVVPWGIVFDSYGNDNMCQTICVNPYEALFMFTNTSVARSVQFWVEFTEENE